MTKRRENRLEGRAMFRLIKAVVILAVLGLIGLTAYAYVGLTPPAAVDSRVPVTLNVD
jgi:Tfp pilus assembly protein PilE